MKKIDANGFWSIEDNPISKVGVFPYLGKQISDELEPNKTYYVYRPAEELFDEKALASFNAAPVPLVDDHTMIGKGFTPAEKKGVHGVITNIRRNGDDLIGNLAIYSDSMQENIKSGKKDLSMGYFCTYDLTPGDFNGQHYDAIQRNLRSNHVALVNQGRCGNEVRVYDAFCFDAAISEGDYSMNENEKNKVVPPIVANKEEEPVKDLGPFTEAYHPRNDDGTFRNNPKGDHNTNKADQERNLQVNSYLKKIGANVHESHNREKERKDMETKSIRDEAVDKRELIREIGAIAGQAGASEEIIRTLMQKAEMLAYNGSEAEKADDACGKDIEEPAAPVAENENPAEPQPEESKENEEEKLHNIVEQKVQDALDTIDIASIVQAKQDLLSKVRPLVGDFNYSKMSTKEIAKYACDHLDLKATQDSAEDVLNCYLNMKGEAKVYSATDSKQIETAKSIIEKYLKGE